MNPVQGLHHVTVMASDAQRNVDFYSVTLGQRMVKVTVNFDDPGTYHLYYGDEVGSPGTVMTHFPWANSARGERGNGEPVSTAYSAPRGSGDFWRARLAAAGVTDVRSATRFGDELLTFSDPDGTWVELALEDGQQVPGPWQGAPLPPEHALRGFHSVTAWVNDHLSVERLLVGELGFTLVGSEPDTQEDRARESGPGAPFTRFRYRGAGAGVGLFVDVVERPGQPRGRFGAGSIHHVALRTVDDPEQAEYLERLRAAGFAATPVQDRQYFHSIYFREPGGVLFEIATDAPGFPDDEPVDQLGHQLKLPAWFEDRRAAIEQRVPRIVNREYNTSIGGSSPRDNAADAPLRDPATLQAGRPLRDTRVACLLIHGRGGTAQDILSLKDEWNLSVYTYLAPQASASGVGNSWYPLSFLAPPEQNQPYLDRALARIDGLIGELGEAGIPPEAVMLGGFSQGACLLSEYLARHPRRYGGAFLYSGALITLAHSGDLAGTPVFMGISDRDGHVPEERFQQTARLLGDMGAQVDARIYPGMGHTINQDELDAVGKMLQRLALETV